MLSKSVLFVAITAFLATGSHADSRPSVVDSTAGITYKGLYRNQVEAFLGIPYAQDTSGANRFKPPKARVFPKGSTVEANAYGPACPQPLGDDGAPLALTPVTDISEDCLSLNVIRPKGTSSKASLPVMVFIYGGGFFTGQNREITNAPDGMIEESVKNGLPIIHVAMNYRAGVFGFAQSDALKSEGSENAGLRDQRLALEWIQKNIKNFGGDPNKVTISGQSSGGLSVGMQILAYGGTKPAPFHRGICESQALEPGITGSYTIDAMQEVVSYLGCNSSSLHSASTVECLRGLDMDSLLTASIDTYQVDFAHNGGDIWLPSVDGDFLPAAPSQLLNEGRFANVPALIGWCEDDTSYFVDSSLTTASETREAISAYYPGVSSSNIDKLLALYPTSDFPANTAAGLSSEFYRTGRIIRDVLMTCTPIGFGQHLSSSGSDVYLYDFNQTMQTPIWEDLFEMPGYGVMHTSEFAYVFGNLSHYDTNDYPFNPSPSDYSLARRAARSWATFAATGKPGMKGKETFQGFKSAFNGSQIGLFVMGGPSEGFSSVDGAGSKAVVRKQKLRERCAFINSAEMVEQLQY